MAPGLPGFLMITPWTFGFLVYGPVTSYYKLRKANFDIDMDFSAYYSVNNNMPTMIAPNRNKTNLYFFECIYYSFSNFPLPFYIRISLDSYLLFCSGGEFLSVMLNSLQWNRVPNILPMRTKSQGNELILSTFNHSTLIKNNTTTHRTTHQVQIVKIQNQNQLS